MTKVNPVYDDLPEIRYHFPKTYSGEMEKSVGDFIIYYEPRRSSGDMSSRGGRQCYFATARLDRIEDDPNPEKPDHFYAFVSGYLEFDTPVPFRDGGHYYESALKKPDGKTSKGAFGRSVRNLPDEEFYAICQIGFAQILPQKDRDDGVHDAPGLAEDQALFERPIIERVVSRPFRDAAFSRQVKEAYSNTCAVSGIKIINGGGRAEAQAAHIRPVAFEGPDSVRNGLALSGTVHWMFDRGLISIGDDFTLLAAKGKIAGPMQMLVRPGEKIMVPEKAAQQPHRQFLEYHRDVIFKG